LIGCDEHSATTSAENRSNHARSPCRRITDRDGCMRSGYRVAPTACGQAGSDSGRATGVLVGAGERAPDVERSGHRNAPGGRNQADYACGGGRASFGATERRASGAAAGDRAGTAVERRGRSPRRHRLAAQSFVSARAVGNEIRRLRHQGVRPVIATAGSRPAGYRCADTLSRLTSS